MLRFGTLRNSYTIHQAPAHVQWAPRSFEVPVMSKLGGTSCLYAARCMCVRMCFCPQPLCGRKCPLHLIGFFTYRVTHSRKLGGSRGVSGGVDRTAPRENASCPGLFLYGMFALQIFISLFFFNVRVLSSPSSAGFLRLG